MFIYFSQNKAAYERVLRKSQLTPLFIALIAAAIIAIMITVNIGKISLDKTRSSNAADAAVLAAASQMAFAFNLLTAQSVSMYGSYQAYKTVIDELIHETKKNLEKTQMFETAALIIFAIGVACKDKWPIGTIIYAICYWVCIALMTVAGHFRGVFYGAMNGAKSSVTDLHQEQYKTYIGEYPSDGSDSEDDEGVWDDSLEETKEKSIPGTMDANVESARETARDYAFLNSGIGEKLNSDLDRKGESVWHDEEGNKVEAKARPSQDIEFNYFIADENTPSMFDWKDGQGRKHEVNADIELDELTDYELVKTIKGYSTLKGYFTNFNIIYSLQSTISLMASIYMLSGNDKGTLVLMLSAVMMYPLYLPIINRVKSGILEDNTFWDKGDFRTAMWEGGLFTDYPEGDYNFVTVKSVTHSRQVKADVSQKHEGMDLGLWTTEYPKVSSRSRASFECMPQECAGVCASCSCVDGSKPCLTHTPKLVAVDEFN